MQYWGSYRRHFKSLKINETCVNHTVTVDDKLILTVTTFSLTQCKFNQQQSK